MASLQKQQTEAIATIDTAKAMLEKVLTVIDVMESIQSQSIPITASPLDLLLKLLKHTDINKERLRLWLTDFLIYTSPALEIGVKAVLLTNLKNMISCSIDPRIPEKYRKQHKSIENINTPNEYGIDINVESIDFLDKLSINPLSKYGRNMYFGQYGVNNVYNFARADDFDAFLWFVIHKGRMPNAATVSVDGSSFTDDVHGSGTYTVKPDGGTLLNELTLISPVDSPSTILPGNTFRYDSVSPGVVSMCIDAQRDISNTIVANTLVPVSDDLSSFNWYARRAAQFGANLFGSYAYAKAEKTEMEDGTIRTTGVNTERKSRDFEEERAICNIQYIDSAYGDQDIPGLANNKLRFTILPKPYMHVPDVAHGEPPWRFKKLLFNAKGEYDQIGKYTISNLDDSIEERIVCMRGETEVDDCDDCTDENPCNVKRAIFSYNDGQTKTDFLYINFVKSGEVVVTNKEILLSKLIECYPGLTVYEFNYDYVMSIKLFDAKVLASSLLEILLGYNVGINLMFDSKNGEMREKIIQMISDTVNRDDIEECFFKFDNSKYTEMLKRAEMKRARANSFGNATNQTGVYENLNKAFEDYDSAATKIEQKKALDNIITQSAKIVSQASEEDDEVGIEFGFVYDLLQNLMMAIMNAILTPKVLMLLEVNQKIMGGTWEDFTLEDVFKAMYEPIVAMVKELRDLLIQELFKLLKEQLEPIKEVLVGMLFRERLDYYISILEENIKNCPFIWFNFGNPNLETKLDDVNYADILMTNVKTAEKPKTENC